MDFLSPWPALAVCWLIWLALLYLVVKYAPPGAAGSWVRFLWGVVAFLLLVVTFALGTCRVWLAKHPFPAGM
jgi:hypothetical protein